MAVGTARRQLPSLLNRFLNAHNSSIRHVATNSKHIPINAPPPGVHIPTPEEAATTARRNALLATFLFGSVGASYYYFRTRQVSSVNEDTPVKAPTEDQHLVNWSGTHECNVKTFYQPESVAELESIVANAHTNNQKLRCVGSGLSPNGLAFQEQGMVSLALMDQILSVNKERKQVTVQAGARVQEVADHLRKYGLTLQNYASIREQTIGGFIQVSAHGTGATIPPVDATVTALKIVTPAQGTLVLSRDKDPELFDLAKVGLGCLGVVAEVTLQCVAAHKLIETTFLSNIQEIKRNHANWLKENKHLRYMWIPNTDAVVVVQCNEQGTHTSDGSASERKKGITYTQDERLEPLRSLAQANKLVSNDNELYRLSATQLRDVLLAKAPLDPTWVAAVNTAEAEFWKRSEGSRIGWSDEILGFDCGGQQWVLEVAFPNGTFHNPDGKDIQYMEDLLQLVEKYKIPAPAPIEQRWTAGTPSIMSPAVGPVDALHSWVGIIMYLPEDVQQRERVTSAFREYGDRVERVLMKKYNAVEHWAKIEMPPTDKGVKEAKARLRRRYPVEKFVEARKRLDPKNILGNELVDTLLGAS